MYRDYNSFGSICIAIILLAAYYISGLSLNIAPAPLDEPFFFGKFIDSSVWFGNTQISRLMSVVAIVATGILILLFCNSYSSGLNRFLPILYTFLATENPSSQFFSPLHISSFALLAATLYFCQYICDNHKLDSLFIVYFLFGISICFYAPIVWVTAAFFLAGLLRSESRTKYLFTATLSLLMPFILSGCIDYLLYGIDDVIDIFRELSVRFINFGHKEIYFSFGNIFRILILIIAVFLAMIGILRNMDRFMIVKFKSLTVVTLFLFTTSTVAVVFFRNISVPACILTSPPVTLLLNEYFSNDSYSSSESGSEMLLSIAAVLFLAERIGYFI